jgi:hypothetical protein
MIKAKEGIDLSIKDYRSLVDKRCEQLGLIKPSLDP